MKHSQQSMFVNKCNEAKPACEYCVHTQRECVYATSTSTCGLQSSQNHARKPAPAIEVLNTTTLPTRSEEMPMFEILDSGATSPSTISPSTISPVTISPVATSPSSTWGSPLFDEQKTPSSILYGGQLTPQTRALLKKRDKYETPDQVDHLTRSLMLNQASSILGISRFELRLLKFFDAHCINLFSFGVNDGIHNAWKYKVPSLFMESDLVRQSMFSFAAVSLSTTLPLKDVQLADNQDSPNSDSVLSLAEDTSALPEDNYDFSTKKNIYLKTTAQFLNTLAKAQERISQVHAVSSFTDPFVAKELTVSSILIFSFLGIQPHGLIKLISFNHDEETDMISISRGSRDVILNCASSLIQSELSGLLFFRVNQELYSPPFKSCNYPIIKYLLQGLYEFQDSTNEVGDATSSRYQIFHLTLDCLTKALFGCGYYKFPIPLFRFLMVIPEDFRTLLYAKHKYALKILYIYACLCFVARFHLFREYNLWRDFVVWYKSETGLHDELERSLYYLVVEKYYSVEVYEDFPYFDPIKLCEEMVAG
ncbi:hypothetical protein CANMA_001119 [Candida margitis]|uniref:uncharacterized protein n=1 Tax=Candida margitis TaxID=1775924 RepID=UPI002227F7A9|nr:uncharacterized protein CANMA_001119 [Candida margitis]KAI5969829.1 hypothetical protein CANMA_001119 [Candida margitis]